MVMRAGLAVVTMMAFIFLVLAPLPVFGGRTVMSLMQEGTDSELMLRGSESGVELGGYIDRRGFFGRRMLVQAAAANPVDSATSVPENELLAPAEAQLDGHAYSSTAPTPPKSSTPFASRFAFLFRSLAKGSSPPSTGTPSPGHN